MPAAPLISAWTDLSHPIIGMVHLRALPGSPRFAGSFSRVMALAVADAQAWSKAGAAGIMMENFGDVPFFKSQVPRETIACMTAVAAAIRQAEPDLPLGINVLRNDGESALAIAAAVGADYIRVNVLSGATVTDQGLIEGRAADVMRYRRSIEAQGIRVLADVRVKHAAPLADRPLQDEVEELIHRAGADGVIVSGTGTGKPTDLDHAATVKSLAGDTPVFIGSGADAKSIPKLKPACNGFIIGTAAKPERNINAPVDLDLARQIVDAV